MALDVSILHKEDDVLTVCKPASVPVSQLLVMLTYIFLAQRKFLLVVHLHGVLTLFMVMLDTTELMRLFPGFIPYKCPGSN